MVIIINPIRHLLIPTNMKDFKLHLTLWLILILSGIGWNCFGQTINAAYVNALYKKYPIVKSDFCADCYLWVNPYYKSIANVKEHRPLVEYELYTKANYALTKTLNIQRTPKKGSKQSGVFGEWHSIPGQPNEDAVYTAANVAVKKIDKKDEIAKGHVQCWILNAFSYDACILSDTYTFNAGAENQSQNVGTEIFTENHNRDLLSTTDVQCWGGTFSPTDTTKGNKPHTFTDGKLKDVYADYYWKVIKYGTITECWLMPNNKTGTQATIKNCIIDYTDLVNRLGFDPCKVLK